MAYRPVTRASLVAFHEVMKRMNKPLGAWSQDVAGVFQAASAVAQGLEEVRRELQPTFGSGVSRSGPGLYGITLDDEEFWCLGAGFRTRDYKRELTFGFEFPRTGSQPPLFVVDLFVHGAGSDGELLGPRTEIKLAKVCARDGTVDWERVTSAARRAVRGLKPLLVGDSSGRRRR